MQFQTLGRIDRFHASELPSKPILTTFRPKKHIRCPHPAKAATTGAAAAAANVRQMNVAPTDAAVSTSTPPSPQMQERGLEFTLEGETVIATELVLSSSFPRKHCDQIGTA